MQGRLGGRDRDTRQGPGAAGCGSVPSSARTPVRRGVRQKITIVPPDDPPKRGFTTFW